VDDAVAAAANHPARYLTVLLGPDPPDPGNAPGWDGQVSAVEASRHHHLGLTYGQPTAGPDASPSEQALGPISDDPSPPSAGGASSTTPKPTLDLGVSR
jgi:hypothetical protein